MDEHASCLDSILWCGDALEHLRLSPAPADGAFQGGSGVQGPTVSRALRRHAEDPGEGGRVAREGTHLGDV